MKIWVFIFQLVLSVPYNQLKSVRKTIRENRRHYAANAKMFNRLNKKLEAYENRTEVLEVRLANVTQQLEAVKAENLVFKASIDHLMVNSSDDYEYDSEYSSKGTKKCTKYIKLSVYNMKTLYSVSIPRNQILKT